MCGGYYEEEFEMKGPAAQFSSTPMFGRAMALCEIENIPCRFDVYNNRIYFENAKAEEKFSIAWSTRYNERAPR